jgi:hypothetical protein
VKQVCVQVQVSDLGVAPKHHRSSHLASTSTFVVSHSCAKRWREVWLSLWTCGPMWAAWHVYAHLEYWQIDEGVLTIQSILTQCLARETTRRYFWVWNWELLWYPNSCFCAWNVCSVSWWRFSSCNVACLLLNVKWMSCNVKCIGSQCVMCNWPARCHVQCSVMCICMYLYVFVQYNLYSRIWSAMYKYCFWLKANVDAEWCTLWLFNIAMENGPFIDGLPI